ncbi:hypothetical protein [Flavobacterium chungnamense]|uniref:HNH endonuclease n=1 Tax=Flavobacterium chungnamense TaxID=706182 RepID=A0ABP7UDQ5_9FLAO
MIQLNRGEEFRQIIIEDPLQKNYAVSNYGRIISYTNDFLSGREIKCAKAEGFRVFRYQTRENGKRKDKGFLVYKLVAQYFIPNDNPERTMVIHLDFSKDNDRVENLIWATRREQIDFQSKNPNVIANKARIIEFNKKADGAKLTSTQVIRIKKMLQRPDNKTRLVMIAKQFNISTQQLYRIRTGENWGHIKV